MAKEIVLDIGIGAGGTYIHTHTRPEEIRIGLDITSRALRLMQLFHPTVPPLRATAEHIPLADNSVTRIEFILPFCDMTVPGLEYDHFALQDAYRPQIAVDYPHGWYPELHRVLCPGETIEIYGDLWVQPEKVEETAQGYFRVETCEPLTVMQLEALGTRTTKIVIENGIAQPNVPKLNKPWEDTLHHMVLVSEKT